jgi:hypothetical protein
MSISLYLPEAMAPVAQRIHARLVDDALQQAIRSYGTAPGEVWLFPIDLSAKNVVNDLA